MSKPKQDCRDGPGSDSGTLPKPRSGFEGRIQPPLSTSTDPKPGVRYGTLSPAMDGETRVESEFEKPEVPSESKVLQGDTLQPPLLLPAPWKHQQGLWRPEQPSDHPGPPLDNLDSSKAVQLHKLQSPSAQMQKSGVERQDTEASTKPDGRILSPSSRAALLPSSSPLPDLKDTSKSAQSRRPPSANVESSKKKPREGNLSGNESTGSSVVPKKKKKKGSPRPMIPVPQTKKTGPPPWRKFENQWRVGQAPTAGLKQSKENANYVRVLTAVSQYYQGNAEGPWKSALRRHAAEYEGKGLTESIGSSIIMAAGLVSAGKVQNAVQILNKTLPLAEALLLSQHPQVCYWLTETAMDSTQTGAGRVRRVVKSRFGPLALRLLGPDHPISLILRTPLTVEQQVRLRREAQTVVRGCMIHTFGLHSYQAACHQWFWGRISAAAGRFSEAIQLLQDLCQASEKVYSSPNSAMAVSALLDLATVMVASGDTSVKVECLLGDALRRIDIITSAQSSKQPVLDAAELRSREGGLFFARLAVYRVLGRVYVMRQEARVAVFYFEKAVELSRTQLSEESSVRKLCETDLEVTKVLELEQAMGTMSLDPVSRLPAINSIVHLIIVEP